MPQRNHFFPSSFAQGQDFFLPCIHFRLSIVNFLEESLHHEYKAEGEDDDVGAEVGVADNVGAEVEQLSHVTGQFVATFGRLVHLQPLFFILTQPQLTVISPFCGFVVVKVPSTSVHDELSSACASKLNFISLSLNAPAVNNQQ